MAVQGIRRSCLRLAYCIPGRDFLSENRRLFNKVIQYNVRSFFCGGLRRHQIQYFH